MHTFPGRATHVQENFSAEQRSPEEETRIPGPNENSQGPSRTEAPAREGPEEIDSLDPVRSESFRREHKLVRRRDFDAVYRNGIRIPGRHFILFVLPNNTGESRLGLTLSRKVGPAVVRNRARRRMREIFRRDALVRKAGLDIVVHARPAIAIATQPELAETFVKAYRQALSRSGRSRRHESRKGQAGREPIRPEGEEG